MKKQYVANIKVGEQINDIFILIDKQISYKRDGNLFANVILADKTGRIKAVMWDNVESIVKININEFVLVSASVGEYKKKLQFVLKKIRLIQNKDDKIDLSDFLPKSERNIEEMFDHLKKITEKIKDSYIKRLLDFFWIDETFVSQFKIAPAAKCIHHAYIGGLLEHVLSMALIGVQMAEHYGGVSYDLLIAGIILHDIGKIRELDCKNNIDYTDEGRFLSHIVIGITMIDEKIKKIPNFPRKTEFLLKHLIVSHHGNKKFGSPEVPKTIEAILLNCIDDMDFKMNSIRSYIETDDNSGLWTSYNRLMERHFYKD